ncbi:NAD(P)/FAD-dependent oxidoreductase [Muricauda oceani]|uniref:NAD(P)/FAD-dependent oxidoreductase n=1 Tax=Flagellimonas oceani TaxID=2698672 RepID=A0A6G7J3H3_9FLAO|nr:MULTISPECIES: NAD(P)/FAD-dependent oxidoreductase [Allomuricauda]MBW8242838.1 NAD(P)/FAD-dependent oxidoreductase [Allomuricauda oceani]QII45431.1 NAD(P)/FAD-dependent oxidoreductase [Allomuricauda oceani]
MNKVDMDMEKYDVIIVGAGPAGLNCAKQLGGTPLRVLVAERNDVVGPKVCAGGLTGKSIESLNLPDELIEYNFNKIHLNHKNKLFYLKDDEDFTYTIDRKELGQWQLKQLGKFDNIEVRTACAVSRITKEYVVLNGRKIGYAHLVGADGASSLVRRYLKLPSGKAEIAMQYIINETKYQDLEVYFDSQSFSAWYAWIFPHNNSVSVGCMGNPKVISSKRLTKNFSAWLKTHHIDVSDGKYEAFPINGDFKGYRFEGNIYLAGDAGGFASRLTGEGIYQALVSGGEIGKMILDNRYHSKEIDELIKLQNRHNKILYTLIGAGKFRPLLVEAGKYFLRSRSISKKVIRTIA